MKTIVLLCVFAWTVVLSVRATPAISSNDNAVNANFHKHLISIQIIRIELLQIKKLQIKMFIK